MANVLFLVLKGSCSSIDSVTFFYEPIKLFLRVHFILGREHRNTSQGREGTERKDEEKGKESRTLKTKGYAFFCLIETHKVLPSFISELFKTLRQKLPTSVLLTL